jgi:hypothetical protein
MNSSRFGEGARSVSLSLVCMLLCASCGWMGCGSQLDSVDAADGGETTLLSDTWQPLTVKTENDDPPATTDPTDGADDTDGGPVLLVSTTSLDFGTQASTLTFDVRNGGDGVLDYHVESYVDWIELEGATGSSEGEVHAVMVHVDRTGLDPGQYAATLEVVADDQSARVEIRMEVEEAPPPVMSLEVDTSRLDFGRTESYLSFTLRNITATTVEYTVTSTASWLEVIAGSGRLGEQEQVTIWSLVNRCCRTWDIGLNQVELAIETDGGETHLVTAVVDVPPPPSQEEVTGWLADLPPLPKVHYSWPLNQWWMGFPDSALAYHWVRITGAVGISGRWSTAGTVHDAVQVCQWVSNENPGLAPTLAVVYSPYHYVFPPDQPPTYTGPEVQQELDLCQQRLNQLRAWLDQANTDFSSDVQISALLLDCEVPPWCTHEQGESDAAVWNAALTAKYDAIYTICESVFPDTHVDWYMRGRPCCQRRFTTQEQGDSYTAASYWTYDLPRVRSDYTAVYEQAMTDGVERLLFWAALGSGYVDPPNGDLLNEFICDLDYDQSYSWQLGAEVNDPWYSQFPDEYAQWDALDAVVLYPGVGDERQPNFFQHFVNYVRGAHGLDLLLFDDTGGE